MTTSTLLPIAPVQHKQDLLYPGICMRGQKISRLEETRLGWLDLDAALAEALGNDHLGIFVGQIGGFSYVARNLANLNSSPGIAKWVVVVTAGVLYEALAGHFSAGDEKSRGCSKPPGFCETDKLWFSTPEGLARLRRAPGFEPSEIAGLVLVDLNCILFKARGRLRFGKQAFEDRPQLVADFRASLADDGWTPPMVIWTDKRPKEVPTDRVATALFLEALLFIDGTTYSCRPRRRLACEDGSTAVEVATEIARHDVPRQPR